MTRQLRYSRDETQRALDIALFINGLPVITFELKNNLTKQTVDDAVAAVPAETATRARNCSSFGRCVAHFAVDEAEVRFCTHLKRQGIVVPPLQPRLERRRRQSTQPQRDQGIDYLWREVLTPREPDPGISSRTTPKW